MFQVPWRMLVQPRSSLRPLCLHIIVRKRINAHLFAPNAIARNVVAGLAPARIMRTLANARYNAHPLLMPGILRGSLLQERGHTLAMICRLESFILQFAFEPQRCRQVTLNRLIDQFFDEGISACRTLR